MPSDRCPARSEGNGRQHGRLLQEFAATPSEKHGQLYAKEGTRYANLGMLSSNLGMLWLFARTPCEGEDAIREESGDPRAWGPVPGPFATQRREREEHPSPRKVTLREHLGTPPLRFEMPNEKGTMSEVKPGSRRPHPQSQWFSLEELAPFTKEVLRVECPLQGREKSPKGAR